MADRRVAVFIGNSIFGDDRVGLLVGETLKHGLEGIGFDVHVMERTGFALLDCLEGYDRAFVVDSFSDDSVPVGLVRQFSPAHFAVAKPGGPHYSGVPEAARLMRDLRMRTPKISILGINVRNPYALSTEMDCELDSMLDAISADVYSRIVAAHRGGR